MTPSRRSSPRWTLALLALTALLVCAVSTPVFAAETGAEDAAWLPLIAKIVNFAILVGALVYFLRGLVVTYLRTRGQEIRQGLTDAAALRVSADQHLSQVRARLASMPAELEALRRIGRDELAGEQVRMKAATEHERQRLLERTTREIDLQFRQARRKLLEHVADVAMARTRVQLEREITPDDQSRLIDRYTTGVSS